MTIKRVVEYRIQQGTFGASFSDVEGLTKEQIEQRIGISLIDADYDLQVADEKRATDGFQTLPAFLKTMTAEDATAYIHSSVLGGKTEAEINADIDALPSTVAGMKVGLKQIGASLVAIRDILELIVKLLLYIRDLVIRYRTQ